MVEQPVLDKTSRASLTPALMAQVLSFRPQSTLQARLTSALWGVVFSIACWLMTPFLAPLAAADDVMKEPPLRHIAMAAPNAKPGKQLALNTVEKGSHSGVREPLQIVIRAQAEWKNLWHRHASIQPSVPPAPTVDFNKEIVVAVFLGEKPTGGHDIAILSVERVDGTLLISFTEKSPPAGAILTQALTQPFHIVRITTNGTGAVGFRRVP
jgi:hypothetical protein